MEYPAVEGCYICPLVHDDHDELILIQTRYWRAVLDMKDQYYLGRAYITSLRHVEHEEFLSFEEWLDLRHVKRRLAQMLKKGLKATSVTSCTLMNNAYRDYPNAKPHMHIHVRPRYADPQEICGVVFEDLEFGEHHQREEKRVVTREVLDEIHRRMLAVEHRMPT